MTDALDLSSVTVGFVGLGNVGGKLAGSLLRNGIDLIVLDLDKISLPLSSLKGPGQGRHRPSWLKAVM